VGRALSGRRVHPALLAAAVSVLALNLRLTMVSLPPLLPDVQRDLGLSGATAGVLTALPVLCMALFAPGAHRLAHRVGREATTLGAVFLVAVGNGLRLPAMTFLVCYTTAALAPVLVGALHDATGSFGVLFGLALVQLALAFSLGPRFRRSIG
jgi:CP family cyanate transporter-like MFS transporter